MTGKTLKTCPDDRSLDSKLGPGPTECEANALPSAHSVTNGNDAKYMQLELFMK